MPNMNDQNQDQYEKDIRGVINFLKTSDPDNATREHAIEMLGDMESLAHLIAHKVVEEDRKEKYGSQAN